MIPILVLVMSLLSGFASGQPIDATESLQKLCKNEPVKMTKLSEAEPILGYIFNVPGCSPEVQKIMNEMSLIIHKFDDEEICSTTKVDQIRDFHSKYILSSAKSQNDITLPKPVVDFFMGFCFKLNSICKKNMINFLIEDSVKLLKQEDFDLMDTWTRNGDSVLNSIAGDPSDYDDILLASELGRLSSSLEITGEKLFIQTKTSDMIKKIKRYCTRRFRPIYEQLILPVVLLSDIGYNYQGEDLEREISEMKTNKDIHKWYKIVFLCESLKDIEIYEDLDDRDRTDGVDKQLIRILTADEVKEFKDQNRYYEEVEGPEDWSVDQIFYSPYKNLKVDDEILDANIKKLVRSFDLRRSESDRVRSKLIRKLGKYIKEKLVSGKIKIVGSIFGAKTKPNEATSANPKEDIIKAVDDYVAESDNRDDRPVAGIATGYVKRVYYNGLHNYSPRGLGGQLARRRKEKEWNVSKIFWYSACVVLFFTGLSFLGLVG